MDGYEFLFFIDGACIFGGIWIAYENGVKYFDEKKRVNKAGISSGCLGVLALIEAIILIIWSFYFIFPIQDYIEFLIIPIGAVIVGIFCIYKGKKNYNVRHIYSDAINNVDQ